MSEEQQNESVSSESQPSESGSTAAFFAVLFYVIAVGLAFFGIYIGFKELGYKDGIVGGDAYNYIIFAGRGSIIIGVAIVAAIIGLGIQIYCHFLFLSKNLIYKAEHKI
ncbi:hypothetical protein GCM10011613_35930 [Cellvibrio zantedeschiae]|uniref:Uncharacterized protein n=1 Tax=Cellvibrio zantedeschiae TaxID=1237077 RepID=A0ABQ3BAQ9_9GAMM|nr:hypothetical protein [Cellvibrio zantedeschiae]GGY87735.1 hypothetical protein GCM10011613_35930 [Cellvibrio zantedeschiae]